MVGRARYAVTAVARLLVAILALASVATSRIAAMPVTKRCGLVAKALAFRVEIHPGVFRPSVAEDAESHRLAYWHDRPLVCAYTRASRDRETPIFAAGETCKDGDFNLFDPSIKKATDGPEACVGIELKGSGTGRLKFSARLNVITLPSGYPADQGRGIGFAPVEGTAEWGRDGWTLKQTFEPK